MGMYEFVCDADEDRDRWLSERRRGITGTDAPKLAGTSRWGTPLTVYAEKRGLGDPVVATDLMEWGSAKQSTVLAFAARAAGCDSEAEDCNALVRSVADEWMLATLDGAVWCDGVRYGAEVKVIMSGASADLFGDGIPIEMSDQCQWAMGVMGTRRHFFAAEIFGRPPVWAWIERDDDRIAELKRLGREMMDRIDRGDPPPPSGADADDQAVRAIVGEPEPGERVELAINAVTVTEEIEHYAREIKALQAREKAAKQQLKILLGRAEVGVLPGDMGGWKQATVERAGYIKVAGADAAIMRVAEALRTAGLSVDVTESAGSKYTTLRRVKRA